MTAEHHGGDEKVLKEGYLMKESKHLKQFKKRWLMLKGTALYSYKETNSPPRPSEIFALSVYNSIQLSKDNDKQFILKSKEKQRKFKCKTAEDAMLWVKYIQQATSNIVLSTSEQTDNNELKMTMASNEDIECRLDACNALINIIHVLKLYQIDYNIEHDTFKQYLIRYGSNLWSDFHHILKQHLDDSRFGKDRTEQEYGSIYTKIRNHKDLCCDIMRCNMYFRYIRQRETESVHKDRHKSVLMDTMDCIHCYFMHSVDIGYRIYNHDDDDIKSQDDIGNLKRYLDSKRVKLKENHNGKNQEKI